MSVLAVVGPTASGKSRVAMEVARRRGDVEIVAVDAFTVYRGLDLATAKPSLEERGRVPHHGVDVLEPHEELSVAQFQDMARRAIGEIRARGRTPLLVGGSGLYWSAVVDDLRFPPTDPQVRARLEERFADDPVAAHELLRSRDPDAAARIDPANLRRSVRALEVLEVTGRPFSAQADDARPAQVYPDLEVAYLEPEAARLRAAIDARAQAMVDAGLLAEAEALRTHHRLSRTAAQAIGYAEAFAVLDGELDRGDLATAVARRTWRYAKRQRSWFRADPRCTATPAERAVTWLAAVA